MLCSRATTTNGKVAIATSVMPGPKPLIFLYHSKHSQADQDQASHGFVIWAGKRWGIFPNRGYESPAWPSTLCFVDADYRSPNLISRLFNIFHHQITDLVRVTSRTCLCCFSCVDYHIRNLCLWLASFETRCPYIILPFFFFIKSHI